MDYHSNYIYGFVVFDGELLKSGLTQLYGRHKYNSRVCDVLTFT